MHTNAIKKSTSSHYSQLSHKKIYLLRKLLFGVSIREYEYAKEKAIAELLDEIIHPADAALYPPVKDYSSIGAAIQDTDVKMGETWINDFNLDPVINEKRKNSVQNCLVGAMIRNEFSIRPKMF